MAPGQLVDALPASGPEQGEPMERLLEDFRRLIVPAITHWNHPGFMAYFANTAPGPGIIAELLAASLNANAMLWKTSPAATELEQVSARLAAPVDGPARRLFGIIYDTASTSSMHAIAAAREMADPEARTLGASRGLTLYCSEEAHSSIEKGAIAIGIGSKTCARFRWTPISACVPRRWRPPWRRISRPACGPSAWWPRWAPPRPPASTRCRPSPISPRATGLWLHVDAAYAGSAAIVPEFRHILNGAERADSLVVNPHKWFFTPFDLSAFYTRRPDILRRAFSLVPEYLRTAQDGRAVNYMDYGVPLGRRFRALKLWFVMRYFGREKLADMIRGQIAWAQELAAAVDADPRFERAAPSPLSVVCFRYKGTDDENRRLLETVNASGEFFLSHTVLRGKYTLHLAIGNMGTTRAHVMRAWEMVRTSSPTPPYRSAPRDPCSKCKP
jgi:aromatic-L-amino-acid decarboxylase